MRAKIFDRYKELLKNIVFHNRTHESYNIEEIIKDTVKVIKKKMRCIITSFTQFCEGIRQPQNVVIYGIKKIFSRPIIIKDKGMYINNTSVKEVQDLFSEYYRKNVVCSNCGSKDTSIVRDILGYRLMCSACHYYRTFTL